MSRVSAQLHGRSPVPSFSGSRPYPGMYGRVAFGVAIEPPRSAYAPSMAPTIRLGKILGIEVGLNWSLIFIYALIVWTLATDVLPVDVPNQGARSEEHTSELQSHSDLVCRLLLEKKKEHTRTLR